MRKRQRVDVSGIVLLSTKTLILYPCVIDDRAGLVCLHTILLTRDALNNIFLSGPS